VLYFSALAFLLLPPVISVLIGHFAQEYELIKNIQLFSRAFTDYFALKYYWYQHYLSVITT